MAKIYCHTNIDCCRRLIWPTRLPETPQVGDLIRSESSNRDFFIELEVCRRTWVFDTFEKEWVLDVELHLVKGRWENLKEFEKVMERRGFA